MERIDRPQNERTDPTRTTPSKQPTPDDYDQPSGSPNARTAPHHALLYEERDDTRRNDGTTERNEASKQRDETRARERERSEHHGYE